MSQNTASFQPDSFMASKRSSYLWWSLFVAIYYSLGSNSELEEDSINSLQILYVWVCIWFYLVQLEVILNRTWSGSQKFWCQNPWKLAAPTMFIPKAAPKPKQKKVHKMVLTVLSHGWKRQNVTTEQMKFSSEEAHKRASFLYIHHIHHYGTIYLQSPLQFHPSEAWHQLQRH